MFAEKVSQGHFLALLSEGCWDAIGDGPQAAGSAGYLHSLEPGMRLGTAPSVEFSIFQANSCGCGCQKSGHPKMELGKWNQGVNPAVFWWFNFDPYPCLSLSSPSCLQKTLGYPTHWITVANIVWNLTFSISLRGGFRGYLLYTVDGRNPAPL